MIGSTLLDVPRITKDKWQCMNTWVLAYACQDMQKEKMVLSSWYSARKPNMPGITYCFSGITKTMAKNQKELDNLERLHEISQLKEDWNGYGGNVISEKVITMSRDIVRQICQQPTIYPTGRSSVQMQFELEDRSYLEFEIFEEKIVCMKVPQRVYAKATFEERPDVDMRWINKIVGEFYGK